MKVKYESYAPSDLTIKHEFPGYLLMFNIFYIYRYQREKEVGQENNKEDNNETIRT